MVLVTVGLIISMPLACEAGLPASAFSLCRTLLMLSVQAVAFDVTMFLSMLSILASPLIPPGFSRVNPA